MNFILNRIKNKFDINNLINFTFTSNGAYAIFENQVLAWFPKTTNLYSDSIDYILKDPIEYERN